MKNSEFSYSLKHLRTFFSTSHFKMGLKHSFTMSFSFDLLMIFLCRCLVISVTYLHLIWVTQRPLISFLCNVEETILLLLTAKETCFYHVSFLFLDSIFYVLFIFLFSEEGVVEYGNVWRAITDCILVSFSCQTGFFSCALWWSPLECLRVPEGLGIFEQFWMIPFHINKPWIFKCFNLL